MVGEEIEEAVSFLLGAREVFHSVGTEQPSYPQVVGFFLRRSGRGNLRHSFCGCRGNDGDVDVDCSGEGSQRLQGICKSLAEFVTLMREGS